MRLLAQRCEMMKATLECLLGKAAGHNALHMGQKRLSNWSYLQKSALVEILRVELDKIENNELKWTYIRPTWQKGSSWVTVCCQTDMGQARAHGWWRGTFISESFIGFLNGLNELQPSMWTYVDCGSISGEFNILIYCPQDNWTCLTLLTNMECATEPPHTLWTTVSDIAMSDHHCFEFENIIGKNISTNNHKIVYLVNQVSFSTPPQKSWWTLYKYRWLFKKVQVMASDFVRCFITDPKNCCHQTILNEEQCRLWMAH